MEWVRIDNNGHGHETWAANVPMGVVIRSVNSGVQFKPESMVFVPGAQVQGEELISLWPDGMPEPNLDE